MRSYQTQPLSTTKKSEHFPRVDPREVVRLVRAGRLKIARCDSEIGKVLVRLAVAGRVHLTLDVDPIGAPAWRIILRAKPVTRSPAKKRTED